MGLFEGGGNLRKSDPVEEASSFFARVDFVGGAQHGMRKMGQPCCSCFSTMPFCLTTVWKQESGDHGPKPETMSPDIFVQL